MAVSKTQIDRLGERLKEATEPTEDDLRMLDDYRQSFGDVYDLVDRKLRELGLEPTGRTAKSTKSIVDKLRRESVRLSQIQDIAGCRLIVAGLTEQDTVVDSIGKSLSGVPVDRRQKPSNGYRAVHFIARQNDNVVEIQIRTVLQHLWAELSEKISDVEGIAVKYGGGPADTQRLLNELSTGVAETEEMEQQVERLPDERKPRLLASLAELHHAHGGVMQAIMAQYRKRP